MACRDGYFGSMKLKPCLALFLALCLSGPAFAQSLDGLHSAEFRSGWQTNSGSYMTALDLRLQPGWKTYWRAPGDAGIPPQFDWKGSENIGRVAFHWPSPQVFDLNGLRSVGYHDALVLPVEVFAADHSQPVKLRLTMHLGICKEVCLPASVRFVGEISGSGAPDPVIRTALAARPLTASEAKVGAVRCIAEPIADGLRVTARVTVPRINGGDEAVVIESADRTIWISEAETNRAGDVVTAVSDLVGASGQPFALDRSGLTLTLISGAASAEIKGCPAP